MMQRKPVAVWMGMIVGLVLTGALWTTLPLRAGGLMQADPTPWIVTATPLPPDVFAAATAKAERTRQAETTGTVTPRPKNMVIATATVTPRVATATATAQNAATATHHVLQGTALAFTTGTPFYVTPTPPPTVPPTQPPPPQPTATPRPSATPTPLFILLTDLTPTPLPADPPPFPAELRGKILFQGNLFNNLKTPAFLVMDADGSNVGVLTARTFYDQAELRDATSPDGYRYAYTEQARGAGQGGLPQIWVYDSQYDSRTTWTRFGAGIAWSPAWSPDGSRIAFTASEARNDEIYVMSKDQWPATRLTDNEWEWDHHPSWSPDGTQIVFSSNRTGIRQLWIMDADGGNQRQLSNFPFEVWNPVWVK